MEISQYYLTTLTNAVKNLGPWVLFLAGGYLIFVKLPFWFLRKSLMDQKQDLNNDENSSLKQKEYTIENYKDFQRRMKQMGPPPKEEKKQTKKELPKKEVISEISAEALFGLSSGEKISHLELKKRYLNLLKQNHPDKVASLGEDFKFLAEKKTKEINAAYEKLKKKAS